MTEPGPEEELYTDPGTVAAGCMMGCAILGAILIAGFLLSLFLSSGGPAQERLSFKLLGAVMTIHWIVLFPLIWKASSKGEVNTRIGLIIVASISALLGTTCGSLVFFS